MNGLKVLYVSHGHPDLRPGGAEVYAWELFLAGQAADRFRSSFVARVETLGPPGPAAVHPRHSDCLMVPADLTNYDFFAHELRDVSVYHGALNRFVRELRPDIIHIQHTFGLGYELIDRLKEWAPRAKLVYTLHEFNPICHHAGQLFTTHDRKPCGGASPERCHACFPDISPWAFHLRHRHLHERFRGADLFVAPSRFLRERYVEWGLPPDRIRFEEYGRTMAPSPFAPLGQSPKVRIGYLGQLNYFKGVLTLLEAAYLLRDVQAKVEIAIYGANLELQSKSFQDAVHIGIEKTKDLVTFAGPYRQEELPRILKGLDWVVVPSLWWENSPLVIQEAFHHGRAILCSDIGGMAEKVRHGVNGLHFRAGDATALAAAIRRILDEPALGPRLQQGIRPVHTMADHLDTLTAWYSELLATRR